jgi:hypothetical protein
MKTLIKTLLVTAVIASTSVSVPVSAYTVFGSGVDSCGIWMDDKTNKPAIYNLKRMWVLGFVSGSGWVEGRTYEGDHHGMIGWIDNYCKAYPLKNISDAAQILVLELEK